MILIYTKQDSKRLAYICEELIHRRLGIAFEITVDQSRWLEFEGPKINYSTNTELNGIRVHPFGLLEERGTEQLIISARSEKWWHTIFFETEGTIPFDIFSASFFLLSRYEEYATHEPDEHGRFKASGSIAVKNNFLEIPLIDLWANQLKWNLEQQFGKLEANAPAFRFLSTIDVDFAYRYRGTGFFLFLMKLFKSLFSGKWNAFGDQISVAAGVRKDPYDTYEWIDKIAADHQCSLQYFLLMRGQGTYDRNISPNHPEYTQLIRQLAGKHTLGIHPSYDSVSDSTRLKEEKELLAGISKSVVLKSRQHYLRYQLPDTYRNLVMQGIEEDYSCGYGDHVGFRASTAHPFQFFEPVENETLPILLYPVTAMDVTLRYHAKLSPDEAMQKVERLMNEVKKVGGIYIHIWHNSNLSSYEGWKDWRNVFVQMHTLAYTKERQEID